MTRGNDRDREPTPLRQALHRLDVLRSDLRETRRLSERGAPLSPQQLARQLDKLDLWLDELIVILGDRCDTRTEP
jgi:hypothetical protein